MKPTTQRLSRSAVAVCATAALLAACGGSDGDSDTKSGGSEYADGGTFTMAIKGDPGKLDPQSSASSQLFTVNQLGYDNLVAVDAESGEIQSQLAADWKVDGTTVTLTLAEGSDLLRRQRLHGDDRGRQRRLRERPEEQEPLPRRLPAGGCDREGGRRHRHGDDHARPAGAVRAQRPGQPPDGLRRRACRTGRPWQTRPSAPAPTCSPRPCPATTTPTRSATATPGARTARRRTSRACPTPSS